MFLTDATSVAIETAKPKGTLRLRSFRTRFGTTAWAVSDEHGLIFVEDTKATAVKRVFGPKAGPGSFTRLRICHQRQK
jgi:hypothetical protein